MIKDSVFVFSPCSLFARPLLHLVSTPRLVIKLVTMSGKPSYAAVSAGKGAKGGKERQGSRSDKSQVGLKQQAGQVSTPSAAKGINWDQEEDEEDDDTGSSSDEAKEEAGAVPQPDEAKRSWG